MNTLQIVPLVSLDLPKRLPLMWLTYLFVRCSTHSASPVTRFFVFPFAYFLPGKPKEKAHHLHHSEEEHQLLAHGAVSGETNTSVLNLPELLWVPGRLSMVVFHCGPAKWYRNHTFTFVLSFHILLLRQGHKGIASSTLISRITWFGRSQPPHCDGTQAVCREAHREENWVLLPRASTTLSNM